MWRAIGGLRARPSRPTPSTSTRLISASLQPPIPAAGCDVMLRAPAEPGGVVLHAVGPARMAFHAMGDGREIEAALDRIAQVLVRHRLLAARHEDEFHVRLVAPRRQLAANGGH